MTIHDWTADTVATYMQHPADLTHLRWFRRCWGFRPAAPAGPIRERIIAVLGERVRVAALTQDGDPDMDTLWAEAVATVTEETVREELDARLGYLASNPDLGDPETDTHVQHQREILGLIASWRTGAPVPERRIVGWAAAAERVGLQPSDLRARATRGMFPEREGEERAAYGQVQPVWSADTLDTWWERKPARGPRRATCEPAAVGRLRPQA